MFLKSHVVQSTEQHSLKTNGWVIQISILHTGQGATSDTVLLYRCYWKDKVHAEFNNLPEALDYCVT